MKESFLGKKVSRKVCSIRCTLGHHVSWEKLLMSISYLIPIRDISRLSLLDPGQHFSSSF